MNNKRITSLLASTWLLLASAIVSAEDQAFHRFWPDNLFAVEFVNDDVGFIAGYSGTVLKTNNGGENWDAHYIGRNELIRRLSFVDANLGWAVGHRGSIFHTTDGGINWGVQHEVEGTYLRDIDFVDANNGWVVGHDTTIWHTADGGKSWQQQELLGFLGRDPPRLHGVKALDANKAVLVGEFGVLGHTENAGETWLVTPVDSTITWLSVTGNAEALTAVGLDGSVARLVIATAEQRKIIDAGVKAKAAKKEARAIAKAKRMKRKYVKRETTPLPVSDIEYHVELLDSGSTEHLFAVTSTPSGEAIAVGRSALLRISGTEVQDLKHAENFPLPYIWLGGVNVTPNGKFWAAGIRGMIVSGDANSGEYGVALQLAAGQNIRLVSSRWGEKQ